MHLLATISVTSYPKKACTVMCDHRPQHMFSIPAISVARIPAIIVAHIPAIIVARIPACSFPHPIPATAPVVLNKVDIQIVPEARYG